MGLLPLPSMGTPVHNLGAHIWAGVGGWLDVVFQPPPVPIPFYPLVIGANHLYFVYRHENVAISRHTSEDTRRPGGRPK